MLRTLLPLLIAGAPVCGADIRSMPVSTVDGTRSCLVATPRSGARPHAPLVLLFHGHMGSAKNTLGQGMGPASPLAAWLTIVDREGVVVAALDGAKGEDRKQGWNDGRPGNSGNPTTDDVAFVAAVIDRLQREEGIDPQRIYAMGMSNGGVFTFRLALERPRPLAAIAAVCASMPGDHPPAPGRHPLSVLLIAGTADPLMPYEGGQVHFYSKLRGAVLGTEATLAYWRTANSLSQEPRTETIPAGEGAESRMTRVTWGEGKGPQVRLLRVEGGGHCEPSPTHRLGWLYRQICGVQNHDVETAEEAWAFFRDKRSR